MKCVLRSAMHRLRATVARFDPAPKLTAFRRDDAGNASLTGLFLVFLVALIGGLSLDHARGLSARAEAQAVADAAARAAAMRLRDGEEAALDAAAEVAGFHRAGLLNRDEITFLSHAEDGFRPASATDGGRPDSVFVVTRRSAANNNPLNTFLLHLSGVDTLNVSGRAIAGTRAPGRFLHCSGGGFFAAGRPIGNSSNDYTDGFCLHGEQGVQFHNQNRFEPGTIISMPDLATFQRHNNNPGADEALREMGYEITLPGQIPAMIAALRAGSPQDMDLPEFVTFGPIHRDGISSNENLLRDTLFVVDGDVDLRGGRHFENIAIVASGDISVAANVVLDNVILAAEGRLEFNSNVRIGGTEEEYCSRGAYGAYLLGGEEVRFNSNNELRGVLVVSGGDIRFNSNNRATSGVYAEAVGDIHYNSRQQLRGCLPGLEDAFTGRGAVPAGPVALLR